MHRRVQRVPLGLGSRLQWDDDTSPRFETIELLGLEELGRCRRACRREVGVTPTNLRETLGIVHPRVGVAELFRKDLPKLLLGHPLEEGFHAVGTVDQLVGRGLQQALGRRSSYIVRTAIS